MEFHPPNFLGVHLSLVVDYPIRSKYAVIKQGGLPQLIPSFKFGKKLVLRQARTQALQGSSKFRLVIGRRLRLRLDDEHCYYAERHSDQADAAFRVPSGHVLSPHNSFSVLHFRNLANQLGIPSE